MPQLLALAPGAPEIPKRYDGFYRRSQKFDFNQRQKPDDPLFIKWDTYLNEGEELAAGWTLKGAIGLALADISLRSRKLIGVVLGSMVGELYNAPVEAEGLQRLHEKLKGHHDIDILILDRHSPLHPKPHEWGIDWWIRPQRGMSPSNGETALWYDLSLAKDRSPAPEREDAIRLEKTGKEVRVAISSVRHAIHENQGVDLEDELLPSGLYLPHPAHMLQIRDHVFQKAHTEEDVIQTGLRQISLSVEAIRLDYVETPMPITVEIARTFFKALNQVLRQITKLFEVYADSHRGGLHVDGLRTTLKYSKSYLKEKFEREQDRFDVIWGVGSVMLQLRNVKSMVDNSPYYHRNYMYLTPPGEVNSALFPVLPRDAVEFKPL